MVFFEVNRLCLNFEENVIKYGLDNFVLFIERIKSWLLLYRRAHRLGATRHTQLRSRTLRVFPKPRAFNITEITTIDMNDFFRTSRHYGVLRYRRFRLDPVSISSELFIEELLIKRLHLFLEQKRKQNENSIRGIQEYKHICENDIDDIELVISRPVDSSEKEPNNPSEAHNNGHLDIELDVLIARQFDAGKPPKIVLFLSSFLLTNVVYSEEVVDGIDDDYNRDWETEEKEVGRSISDPA